ncbi:MAG: GNAT family N-acetyltransferase [Treponema sp.]|nr:GNAT family N-acetyltransferase [Treponema sp.]
MNIKYTPSGYIYISQTDDCNEVVDAMLATNYDQDFCVALDFSPEFVIKLMEAGFLVMSMNVNDNEEEENHYILLPKLHLVRSALFYDNLHVKKSIKRFLGRYELRPDAEFDYIIDRCVEKHGPDWLTPPLVNCIKEIRETARAKYLPANAPDSSLLLPNSYVYPASFALYKDGILVAGEFGIVYGKVYTSYSGFYDEDNAGTVQIIHTTHYLQDNGFLFFDMGMPLNYKTDLGATDISPECFVELFRL